MNEISCSFLWYQTKQDSTLDMKMTTFFHTISSLSVIHVGAWYNIFIFIYIDTLYFATSYDLKYIILVKY